jgi:RimJ/RimL family protein N-acetyltransferase
MTDPGGDAMPQINPAADLVLEGAHVRLEPLAPTHLGALWAVAADPAIWRWTSAIRSREDLARWLDEALAARAAGRALPLATIERASGRPVGSTRFGAIEPAHRRVEIGWTWIAPPWQRTAINTEAKHLMLRHAFEVWGCLRVELKTDALNAASRAAILRIGAREEGTLRHHMIMEDGRVRDTVYYSILAGEWPEVKRALERRLAQS